MSKPRKGHIVIDLDGCKVRVNEYSKGYVYLDYPERDGFTPVCTQFLRSVAKGVWKETV